ncbi:MAG: hypothetical protein MZV64_49635 [Ignavibacteriales bacterium]|nr:hypothetical protein [Ignavibacteriales bacterium]
MMIIRPARTASRASSTVAVRAVFGHGVSLAVSQTRYRGSSGHEIIHVFSDHVTLEVDGRAGAQGAEVRAWRASAG